MKPTTRAIVRIWLLGNSWNIIFHVMGAAVALGAAAMIHVQALMLPSIGSPPFVSGVVLAPLLGLAAGMAIRSTLERALRRPSALLIPRFHYQLLHLVIRYEAVFWGILVFLIYPPWCEFWNVAWLWRFPVLLVLGVAGSALSTLPLRWMSESPSYVNGQIANAIFLMLVFSSAMATVDPSAVVLWAGLCGAVILPISLLLWRRFLRLVRRPGSRAFVESAVPRGASGVLGKLSLLPDPIGRAWLRRLTRRPARSPAARIKLLLALWIAGEPTGTVMLLAIGMGAFLRCLTYLTDGWASEGFFIVIGVAFLALGGVAWRSTWLDGLRGDIRLPATRRELVWAGYCHGALAALLGVFLPLLLGAGVAHALLPAVPERAFAGSSASDLPAWQLFHAPWRILFMLCFAVMLTGVVAFAISPLRSKLAIEVTECVVVTPFLALLIWRVWAAWPGDLFWLVPGVLGGVLLYALAAERDVRRLEFDRPGRRGGLGSAIGRLLRAEILGRTDPSRPSPWDRVRERLNRPRRGPWD